MDSAEIDLYGVRDGEPAALDALAHRRGPNVVAYCNQVCGPAVGPAAATETFARMRAVLHHDENLAALDADQLLRRATRHTAAGAARTPQGPPPTGAIAGRATTTCLDVAVTLAACADGRIGPDQRGRLRIHIEACERCSALAEITRRADASYTDPASDRIGSDLAARITTAMAGVPEQRHAPAPPPHGAEQRAVPVFPVIPELDDELAIGAAPAHVTSGEEIEPGAEIAVLGEERRRRGRWSGVLRGLRSRDQEAERAAA